MTCPARRANTTQRLARPQQPPQPPAAARSQPASTQGASPSLPSDWSACRSQTASTCCGRPTTRRPGRPRRRPGLRHQERRVGALSRPAHALRSGHHGIAGTRWHGQQPQAAGSGGSGRRQSKHAWEGLARGGGGGADLRSWPCPWWLLQHCWPRSALQAPACAAGGLEQQGAPGPPWPETRREQPSCLAQLLVEVCSTKLGRLEQTGVGAMRWLAPLPPVPCRANCCVVPNRARAEPESLPAKPVLAPAEEPASATKPTCSVTATATPANPAPTATATLARAEPACTARLHRLPVRPPACPSLRAPVLVSQLQGIALRACR